MIEDFCGMLTNRNMRANNGIGDIAIVGPILTGGMMIVFGNLLWFRFVLQLSNKIAFCFQTGYPCFHNLFNYPHERL